MSVSKLSQRLSRKEVERRLRGSISHRQETSKETSEERNVRDVLALADANVQLVKGAISSLKKQEAKDWKTREKSTAAAKKALFEETETLLKEWKTASNEKWTAPMVEAFAKLCE